MTSKVAKELQGSSDVHALTAAEERKAAMMDVALQSMATGKLKAAVGILERQYNKLHRDVQEETVKYAIDTLELDTALHKATETLGYLREVQALTEENRLRAAAPASVNREFREQSSWWTPREALPNAWFPTPTVIVPPPPGSSKAASAAGMPRGARPVSPRNQAPSTPAPPPRGSAGGIPGLGPGPGPANGWRAPAAAGEQDPAAAPPGTKGGDKALRPSSSHGSAASGGMRRTPRASAPGSPASAGNPPPQATGDGASGASSSGGASVGRPAAAASSRLRRGASSDGFELQPGGGGFTTALYDGGGDAAVPGTGPVGPLVLPHGIPRYTVNLFAMQLRLQQRAQQDPDGGDGGRGSSLAADGDEEAGPSEEEEGSQPRSSHTGEGPRPVSSPLQLGTGFRALADEDPRDGFRQLALNAAIGVAAARVEASNAKARASAVGRAIALVGGGVAAPPPPGPPPLTSPTSPQRKGGRKGHRHTPASPTPPPPLLEGAAPLPEPRAPPPPDDTAAAGTVAVPQPPPEALSGRRPSALVLGARRSLQLDSFPRASSPGFTESGPLPLSQAADEGGGGGGDSLPPPSDSRLRVPAPGMPFALVPTPPPAAAQDGRPGSRLGSRAHRGVLHSHPAAQSLDSPPGRAAAASPGAQQPAPAPRMSLSGVSGRLRRGASTSGVLAPDTSQDGGGGGSSGSGAPAALSRARLRTLAVPLISAGGEEEGRGSTPGSAGTPTRALLAPSLGSPGADASPGGHGSRPDSPAVAAGASLGSGRMQPLWQAPSELLSATHSLPGGAGPDAAGGGGAPSQRQGSAARPRSGYRSGGNSGESRSQPFATAVAGAEDGAADGHGSAVLRRRLSSGGSLTLSPAVSPVVPRLPLASPAGSSPPPPHAPPQPGSVHDGGGAESAPLPSMPNPSFAATAQHGGHQAPTLAAAAPLHSRISGELGAESPPTGRQGGAAEEWEEGEEAGGGDRNRRTSAASASSALGRPWGDALSPTRPEPAPFSSASAAAAAAAAAALGAASPPAPQRPQRQASPSRGAARGGPALGSVGSISLVLREAPDPAGAGQRGGQPQHPPHRPTSAHPGAGPAAAPAHAPVRLFSRRGADAAPASPPFAGHTLSARAAAKLAAPRPGSAGGGGRVRRASMPVSSSGDAAAAAAGVRPYYVGGPDTMSGQLEGRGGPWEAPQGSPRKAGPGRSKLAVSGSGGVAAPPASSSLALSPTLVSSRQAAAGGAIGPAPAAVGVPAVRLSSAGDAHEAGASEPGSASGEDVRLGVGAMPSVRKRAVPVVKQTLDI